MPFAAILDASVLYPLPLRDTLLRVAEIELYDPYWSERILDEVTRNLILDRRATDEQARNLTDAIAAPSTQRPSPRTRSPNWKAR
jgi:hypothetical protein